MTIDEMIAVKEARGYSFKLLSEYTGVPVVTLQKIFSRATKSPRRATLEAIERVLSSDEDIYTGKAYAYAREADRNTQTRLVREEAGYYGSLQDGAGQYDFLRDGAGTYGTRKSQGAYTIEDYRALPEERRVELIDGLFYDMTSPTTLHQEIASIMHMTFYNFIRSHKKSCKVFEAPLDVQICCDDKTMVQPDLIVVCDRDKIHKFGIMGAPDFLLEILSPSTRKKDMTVKLNKYMEAGVREYWIIDPGKQVLIKYYLEDPEFIPNVLPLKGMAAVEISAGELAVDLGEIAQAIREYGE